MYATPYCMYCIQATRLLDSKGVEYHRIEVDRNYELRREMELRTGARTVPQILIDGHPIGGYDALSALDRSGELDRLLFPDASQDTGQMDADARGA
jgi:glutaredoxin 3